VTTAAKNKITNPERQSKALPHSRTKHPASRCRNRCPCVWRNGILNSRRELERRYFNCPLRVISGSYRLTGAEAGQEVMKFLLIHSFLFPDFRQASEQRLHLQC
jgi:hypothetical protein